MQTSINRVYTCDPDIFLTGKSVQAFTHNMRSEMMIHFLEAHHLHDIDPDEWYPLQDVLNVMNDIASNNKSAMMDFVSIGMAAVDFSELPPDLESIPFADFIRTYAKVFAIRHQGGTPGTITVDTIDDNHVTITTDIAYPDDVFYGIWYGYARKFLTNGEHFTVYYDDDTLRKDQGGDHTIYHIHW